MNAAIDLLKSLYTMAMMVEARDAYTGGHLWRVSRFSMLLAQDAGLSAIDVKKVALGGFLHDLGKVGVPDAILNKRDKLTDEEYETIKNHPQVGADLLSEHPLSALAMDAVLKHHETPDGRGYPAGLSAADIPQVAKMVGIADAFDAMTSSRPYRAGMPIERALSIIADNLGTQFDESLGQRFIALGRQGKLDHIVGHSEPGIPLQACLACGPIIAVPRARKDGQTLYCPSCTTEYRLSRQGRQLSLSPTGLKNAAAARRPLVDQDLIADLIEEARQLLQAGRPSGWLSRLWG